MLHTALDRRAALRWFAAAGGSALPLVGCGGGGGDSGTAASAATATTTATGTTTTATTSSSTSCAVIPEETAGPYPGDGSNGANALTLSGIVRRDIRTSLGTGNMAAGVLLTVTLELVNTASSCAPLSGYAIYLWHATREGLYSMYSTGVTAENFLRGVQVSDSSGLVTFSTIFPGCYDGRMPHIHLEVYPSAAVATQASAKIKTTQLGFPVATLNEVYTSAGYGSSVTNLARISYATDNVFSDGTSLQIASMTGNATAGYTAALRLGIAR